MPCSPQDPELEAEGDPSGGVYGLSALCGPCNMIEHQRETNAISVLVVDDADLRDTVRLILDMHGLSVTEARNGCEALELFAPGRFALVLTDCEMPGMTGAELIKRIQRLAPEQRIGLVSGHVQNCADVLDEVDFHLGKPFEIDELSWAVRRVLNLDGV